MSSEFERDPYPGRPKILFLGVPYSTHVQTWIDLLAEAEFNIRLFGVQDGYPPHSWRVRTYLTTLYPPQGLDPDTRQSLFPTPEEWWKAQQSTDWPQPRANSSEEWLAQIIEAWQPDIVHTLGLDPAGKFYFNFRYRHPKVFSALWVNWLWGGSDIELSRLDPELAPRIARLFRECDQILSDNLVNHHYLLEMGVRPAQLAVLNPMPGVGGIDIDRLVSAWQGLPSQRRVILWPKTYEGPWSKALPVLEAIRLAWDHIQPCDIYMLSVNAETRMYFYTMPEAIRKHCRVFEGVPREQALAWMVGARVMLAPSLVDGMPNSLYEAMAAGAFPVVSPLDPITAVVQPEQNVLFARNLYPQEIAEAVIRAMTDDRLVDEAAQRNLALVRRLADRAVIRPQVIAYYEGLVAGRASRNGIFEEPAELFALQSMSDEQAVILDQRQDILVQRQARFLATADERQAALDQQAQELETRAASLEQQEANLHQREDRYNSLRLVRAVRKIRQLLRIDQ